ncbi:DMT family transporter [Klebsiella pneumoniae subsp. pneumoniae]|nr:DMT family transporter [Klebsiella pneumoniae subsp. pneumoniae]
MAVLAARWGCCAAPFLTFATGALVTGLLILFFAPATSVNLLQVPKWQLLGAFCGVPYIVIMVLAVQRIGTATATVAVIFGQLTMSLLIDNFGWLGNSTMAFSPARLAAVICLAPRAVLNLHLREVGYLPRGGPRRTVSCADASGIVNIA